MFTLNYSIHKPGEMEQLLSLIIKDNTKRNKSEALRDEMNSKNDNDYYFSLIITLP